MTEKDYNPNMKEKKAMSKQPDIVKANEKKSPIKKEEKAAPDQVGLKEGVLPSTEDGTSEGKEKKEDKVETKPEEKKKPIVKKPVVKKTEAVVNGKSLPISTKHSAAICKFIKGKRVGDAIRDLEQVIITKKAVPMKGEIPHRKGKGMMSGRFPKKASEQFIKLLKSLAANATANSLDEPIIVEAIANMAQRPYGRFGRTRKKRTHVTLKCKEKKIKNK